MKLMHISNATAEQWNAFVATRPHFALMQSYQWGEFKRRLGWKAIRIAITQQQDIIAGAQMLIRPLGLASFAYIPRGPLIDWQNTPAVTLLLDALHQVARQHRALFLRIEPPLLHSPQAPRTLQDQGFRATAQTNQPRCTLLLDLQTDIQTIFANLPQRTKHHIRACSRKGVTTRQGQQADLGIFYRLMHETGQRAKFPIRSPEYYAQEFKTFAPHQHTTLLLADYRGQTIAAEMPFAFGPHGAALHGASSSAHRKLPVSDLLTWEGIKWAKNSGCRSYDLWGIPDQVGALQAAGQPVPENKKGGLWGVYYFKKGFGGDVLYYVGAYDHVYARLAYAGATRAWAWLESISALANFRERI
jgi:peptidoglycan pentaglycine glycine transferase (the first glycine)